MDLKISQRIVDRFLHKFSDSLELDVAIVGAGPSGLVAAHDLARAGRKVALFESKLQPGGGAWGGAMLFNEIVVQVEALSILEEFGIRHSPLEGGLCTADSVEVAAALTYRAVQAGARLFNGITVEDMVVRNDRVAGVVINWQPVMLNSWHVDPLTVVSSVVLDATGHHALLTAKLARKAGVRLATTTGDILGERPMWAEQGERDTVENTRLVYPGLYVSGMAANGVFGSFRMGPIFGGMFLSGRKAAYLINEELG